ncbi:MAG: hypothetical protein QOF18_1462 [Frankiaceae bacterium]|jgi:hypothetical protein|nr:hypothetical protein [Frankiaceae bacterium]
MSPAPDPERVVPLAEIELAVQEAEVPVVVAPRDAGHWAPNVTRLTVDADRAAVGFNVAGKRVTGPQQGFGRLWQRTYTTQLGSVVGPQRLISEWKAHFGEFWTKGNRFHGLLITPGEVAPIAVNTGAGLKLSTGVLVLYADDESFTFMTPEGHMFAGWITFSAFADAAGTAARIQVLIRPNDPIFELGWPVMKRMEDRFWMATLRNVAAHFGVLDAAVEERTVLVDKHRIWHNARNVWHNAGIRSVLHLLTAPVRAVRRRRLG